MTDQDTRQEQIRIPDGNRSGYQTENTIGAPEEKYDSCYYVTDQTRNQEKRVSCLFAGLQNNKNDLNQNRVALNTEKTQRVSHVL